MERSNRERSRNKGAHPAEGSAPACLSKRMTPNLPPTPLTNSYWVTPGRFLAGEHPGGDLDETSEERLTALLAAGIRTFIDLTEEHESDPYAIILRCLAEEQELEVTYLRIPIPDRGLPSEWTMRCILDVIDGSMGDGRAAYVHCFAGIGRTGTVVGCHLRRHARAKAGEVVAGIAALRQPMPLIQQASPHTPEQVQMVESWKDGA